MRLLPQIAALVLSLALLSPTTHAAKPESSCVPEEFTKTGQNGSPYRKHYLKCLIRGESPKVVISNSHPNMNNSSVANEKGEITAWEFYGAEIACAARTADRSLMSDLTTLLQHLDQAEALCLYYVDPETGLIIGNPKEQVQTSSAGVSNNF